MPRKKTEKPSLDLNVYTKNGSLRKRKRKQPREYFSQTAEDAIIKYIVAEDPVIRNELFDKYIDHSFHKLAENLINTFKFYYTDVDNIEHLKHEVVVFLLEKIAKYDPAKGKAYSYFGTIAKRYLIVYCETNFKKLKQKAPLEEVDEDKKVFSQLVNQNTEKEMFHFIEDYIKYVEKYSSKYFVTEKELEIVDAVLEIFKRREGLEILNKQQIYLYIREITNQPTPNITKVVKRLKEMYKHCMNLHYKDGDLETSETYIY